MNTERLQQQLAHLGVVPVVTVDEPARAVELADALAAGGLPVVEVTLRTPEAVEVIRRITRERPKMLVGAGTVLSQSQLSQAIQAGAVFGVAPGLNPDVVSAAAREFFPFFPGVMTPSEIEQALNLGVQVVKFFPAEAAGGVAMLKSLAAPYAHTGLRFIPTGGLKTGNLGDYLSVDAVVAVGGTWLASRDAIQSGRWDSVTANCREALRLAREARGGPTAGSGN